MVFSRIDEMGKPAWLAIFLATVLVSWPLAAVVLLFLWWTGRLQQMLDALPRGRWAKPGSGAVGTWWAATAGKRRGSGNETFDAYREAELGRLDEEQREFQAFLDRLRRARDKEEFDRFMAERGQRQAPARSDA